MYQSKIPKRENVHKTPYTIFQYAKRRNILHILTGYKTIISIDPATDTYAFRIERRWDNGKIETLAFDRVKFNRIIEDSITVMYKEISEFLNKYSKYYLTCDMVLIERQIPPNYNAIRVYQHTISYFMNVLESNTCNAIIYDVNSKLKGSKLGAPKGINRTYLKKWGVVKAKELLLMRHDTEAIRVMESYGAKQDDMADTVIMIEAMFVELGLPLTKPMRPTLNIINNIGQQTNSFTVNYF